MKIFGSVLLIFFSFGLVHPSIAATPPTTVILSENNGVVWGFDFIDSENLIFTEREGNLKILSLVTKKIRTIGGAPKVRVEGQGGLLDVRIHPKNPTTLFLTYSEPSGTREEPVQTTALVQATLKGDKLVDLKKIISANAPSNEDVHFGSRIEFDDQGFLYMTVGDRNARPKVQDPKFHNGKILRFTLDGTVPKSGQPYMNQPGALPEIWSIGHRSPQGLAFDPKTKTLWEAEMGPKGGDELNQIEAGKNYGWPEVTFGREYYGIPIGVKEKPGSVSPVAHWVPSISPSAITVYRGKTFPEWDGNIFMGCLSGTQIRRLVTQGKESSLKVTHQEVIISGGGNRYRNLRVGPDGYLYFSTDGGKIGYIRP